MLSDMQSFSANNNDQASNEIQKTISSINGSEYIELADWISQTEFPMNYTYSITAGNRTITYQQANFTEAFVKFTNATLISKNGTELIEQNKNILLTYGRWPIWKDDGTSYLLNTIIGFNDSYFIEMVFKQIQISKTEEIITLYKVYSGNYTQSMVKALTTFYNVSKILPNITIDYTLYQLPIPTIWNTNITNGIMIFQNDPIVYRYPENARDLLGEDHWEILTWGKYVEMKYTAETIICISMEGKFTAIFISYPPPVDNNNNYIPLMIGGGIIGIIGAIVILKKYKH